MPRRAFFLDRDGTLSEEIGHVVSADRLQLIEGAAEAIRLANQSAFQAVVVTNQSGIARGLLDEATLADVHDRLRQLLSESGARLDGIYYCPHHPSVGGQPFRRTCECRKPRPGMLQRARDEMGIDLATSFMIGDRLSDLQAGREAGVTPILVLTGKGAETQAANDLAGVHVARELREALVWALRTAEMASPASRRSER